MITIEEQFKTMIEGPVDDIAIIVTYSDGSSQFMASDVILQPVAMMDIAADFFEHLKQHANVNVFKH